MNRNWRFHLGWAFFGLTSKFMEGVYEQFFILKHFGGWSLTEAYNLPIGLRKWFVDRPIRQIETENEAMERHVKAIQNREEN